MKRVSLQDIAEELKLSRNTVAKALKDSEIVSEYTKQKVIEKALEMGYEKMSEEMKRKAEKRNRTSNKKIAVISKKEIAEFWNRIIVGIAEHLEDKAYSFMLYFVSEEDEKQLTLPKDLVLGEVDGVIALSIFSEAFHNKLFEMNYPTVFFDVPLRKNRECFRADAILVEGYNSTYTLTKKLIEEGRKSFSFIGDVHYCQTIFDRWMGFQAALADYNIPLLEELCITAHVPLRYCYDEELRVYLEQMPYVPDAIICANDDIGVSVVQFFAQEGYKVPESIAVTGFDDKIASQFSNPPLTTVHVNNEYIGRRLVQVLLARMEEPKRPYEMICVETYPVYRKTT